MLTLDLFEFLRRRFEIPAVVEQEDALIVELFRRLVGNNLLGATEQAGNTAASPERTDQHDQRHGTAQKLRERRTPCRTDG